MIGEIAKDIILAGSLFSLGLVSYLAYRNVQLARHTGGHERRLNVAYALARSGYVLTVGLVADAVMRAPEIPFDSRVALYTLGVVLAAVGYAGVIYESRKLPPSQKQDAQRPTNGD